MKLINQIIIASFVVSLAGGLWLIFELKTKYLGGVSATPVGELKFDAAPEMSQKINAFLEAQMLAEGSSQNPNSSAQMTCEHVLLARDDQYAYIDHVCGVFEKASETSVVQKQGPRGPVRAELNSQGEVLAVVRLQEGQDKFIDQYRALFPDAVQVLNSKKTDKRFENLLPRAYERQQNRQSGT